MFLIQGEVLVIMGEVTGLAPGEHGFHIHEFGDYTNGMKLLMAFTAMPLYLSTFCLLAGCMSAGPHFNPTGVDHGGPFDEVRHVGDCGNLIANESGVVKVDIKDCLMTLTGEYGIIGRTAVVNSHDRLCHCWCFHEYLHYFRYMQIPTI